MLKQKPQMQIRKVCGIDKTKKSQRTYKQGNSTHYKCNISLLVKITQLPVRFLINCTHVKCFFTACKLVSEVLTASPSLFGCRGSTGLITFPSSTCGEFARLRGTHPGPSKSIPVLMCVFIIYFTLFNACLFNC